MRDAQQLVHSRARVGPRSALLPLEGFPFSRLPGWPEAQVRILAALALGAQFAEYLIDLPAGKEGHFVPDDSHETFYFVVSGGGKINGQQNLKSGSFGLVPPNAPAVFRAEQTLRMIVLRKRYEPTPGIDLFKAVHGHESQIKKEIWAANPHSLLQTLIPDEFAFDLAMNIFTFDPGFGLPVVETHVMEHGLYFLAGKGLYYLEDHWLEVQQDDFIWMGPYCPQSFYATGGEPSRYIYYKNVNRDIVV
jgi:(S)-ureidoglycine aminohydrolase